MATAETRLDYAPVSTTGATDEHGESLADRVLSLAAMVGAVGGALAGAALGAGVGSAYPVLCGTVGTMLGSGLAAGGGCLLAHVWTSPVAGERVGRERGHAARSGTITPARRAG